MSSARSLPTWLLVALASVEFTMLRLIHLLAAIVMLCASAAGCTDEPSAFPLSLQTVREMSPANTAGIEFEVKRGNVFVSIQDKYGDAHIHKLDPAGLSTEQAVALLKQKQAELRVGK